MRESRRPPSFTKHLVSAMKQGAFFVSSLYGSTEHTEYTDPRSTQSTRKIVEDYFHDFDTQAKAGLKPMASTAQDNALRTLCSIPQPRLVRTKLKSVASTTVTLTLHLN